MITYEELMLRSAYKDPWAKLVLQLIKTIYNSGELNSKEIFDEHIKLCSS